MITTVPGSNTVICTYLLQPKLLLRFLALLFPNSFGQEKYFTNDPFYKCLTGRLFPNYYSYIFLHFVEMFFFTSLGRLLPVYYSYL